jgi:hypothetical protein
MKKIILFYLLIALFSSRVFSQDPEFEYYKSKEIKTLLGHNRSGGGYCVFSAGYSEIDNKHAVLFGGRIGWLASHYLGIGIGGTGFMNEYHYDYSLLQDVSLAGGYGGIYLEPILFPRSPVHLSFPVLFGAGGISYIPRETDFNDNIIDDSGAFLIIEPAAELELNVTRFFRLALGASYRFPTSFDIGLHGTPAVNTESIRGISYSMSVKFGKF